MSKIFSFLLFIIDSVPDKSKAFATPLTIQFLKVLSLFDEGKVYPLRILVCRLLPWNPLARQEPNPTDIFILTTKKDLEILPISLYSITQNLASANSRLIVVCPARDSMEVISVLCNFNIADFSLKTDEELFQSFRINSVLIPHSHSRMQILKFICALSSGFDNCLVLDGDTVFLKRRVWSSGERMVIVVPPEYQMTHVGFVKKYFRDLKHHGMGFTTQSQLMRKSLVEEMISSFGGNTIFVDKFVNAMNDYSAGRNLEVFPCEWQIYGDWLLQNYGDKVYFSSYLNMTKTREALKADGVMDSTDKIAKFYEELKVKNPKIASVSLHAYKV